MLFGGQKNFSISSGIGWEQCELLIILAVIEHSNPHHSQPILDGI